MRFSRRPRGSERRGPDGAHEGADAKWLLVARDGLLASILLLAVLLLAGVLVTGEQMNAAAPVVWSFFHGHTLWESRWRFRRPYAVEEAGRDFRPTL